MSQLELTVVFNTSTHKLIYFIFDYLFQCYFYSQRSMWRSTWNPRWPHHKIHVHCLVHVQPLLRSLERQTSGTEPRIHSRGLACQIPQHPSVAADWFRGSFRCEANCHPGSVWCQPVGYIIYCFLQQQWSQIFPLQAGEKNQGRAISFFN